MRKQRGITLSGFLMWAILLFFGLLLGFKLGPAYFEYLTIKKQLQAIGKDSEVQSGQRRDVEQAFLKRSIVENIEAVKPADLVISKEADGVVISAEYTTCVPIVGNLRACMDFAPSSR